MEDQECNPEDEMVLYRGFKLKQSELLREKHSLDILVDKLESSGIFHKTEKDNFFE